jgi:hypothetical protein
MKLLGLLATVVGLVLMVLSFLWAALFPPVNRWSDEQAKEHQQASAKYHQLQHTVGHQLKSPKNSSPKPQPQSTPGDLEAAKKRWQEIEAARVAARDSGEQTKWWLRLGGAAVAAIGVVALVSGKQRERKRPHERDSF